MDNPRAIPSLMFAVFGILLALAGHPALGIMCTVASLMIGRSDEARR